jgi:hypothetical protein
LVERTTENREVTGSTPVGATAPIPGFYRDRGFFFPLALPPRLAGPERRNRLLRTGEHRYIVAGMCRNIRCLHNFEPPTSDDEVREAALQFVRKVSGSTHPSRANTPAFEQAIDEIAQATRRMLDQLVTNAPAKSRDLEAIKGRERHEKRMEREVRIRTAG